MPNKQTGSPVTAACNPKIEAYLQDDPQFLQVYQEFVSIPWKNNHLNTKVKALLLVALSASPTHLSGLATRDSIRSAFEAGATREEIAEILKIVSILGVHACSAAIPLVMQHFEAGTDGVTDENSVAESEINYTPEQLARKERFVQTMGYWNDFRDYLLKKDEAYFDAYYEFLTVPIRRGILEPKLVEFVYIAIDSSTTHLFPKGIDLHIANAKKYGATEGEIVEVIQLASTQGFDTLLHMYPILDEEAENYTKVKG